jgi:hypothetical protein
MALSGGADASGNDQVIAGDREAPWERKEILQAISKVCPQTSGKSD